MRRSVQGPSQTNLTRLAADPFFSFLLFSCLFFTGCWTSTTEGDALRRDVTALQTSLNAEIQKAKQDRTKLQKIMEQATALLTRNSADVGAQVERLQAKVDKFSGQMEERQNKLNDLAQKFSDFQAKVDVKLEGLTTQSKSPPVPEDKDQLFNLAASKLSASDHQEARRLLRHFISRFSSDPRVDQAQLMLGDSYYAEQKFAPAIVEYKVIIEQYKQSAAVPDALAKIGMSFYQLKFCSDAQLFLSQLLKKYKKHPQANTAQKVLKLIQRYRTNQSVCRP
jgi:TolA-binding protein